MKPFEELRGETFIVHFRNLARQGETDESVLWSASHRGDIAEVDCQNLATDLKRCRCGKVEVDSLQQHVGCEKYIADGAYHDGRVVTDSGQDVRRAFNRCAKGFNQPELAGSVRKHRRFRWVVIRQFGVTRRGEACRE